jgi:NarL family two-component system response regulator LiaR
LETIKVLVVDDHHMVRCGLRDFLERHNTLELVGEARTAEEALGLIPELQPDVVVMDIKLPGEMDGIAATRQIVACHPDVKVIALTGLHRDILLKEAIRAGACGYLLKTVTCDELAEAIRKAHSGESLLPKEIMESLMSDSQIELTAREREVLDLITRGMTNQQIGHALSMSKYTAQFHVRNIRTKLSAKNRAEAGALAVRLGLVEPPKS